MLTLDWFETDECVYTGATLTKAETTPWNVEQMKNLAASWMSLS